MKKIFLLLLLLSSFSLIYAQTIEELRDSMAAATACANGWSMTSRMPRLFPNVT